MKPAPDLPLEGLYLYLARNGFPLSVRDYLDALAALRQGYGLHHRDELCWLCETLWARSDQERLRLQRLFRAFPWPQMEIVDRLGSPSGPAEAASQSRAGETGGLPERKEQSSAAEQSPAVEFAGPRESGVALPRAVWRQAGGESFIFTPRPAMPLRSLIIAWRRFRRAQRSGPRTEPDMDATIAEKCRRGILAEPFMIPARRNQARLVVLVDASPSMAPWRSFHDLLADSLKASQLAHASLYFFDNHPEETVFSNAGLTQPLSLDRAIRDNPESPLLIVSDGGAARGSLNRGRLAQTKAFLQGAKLRADWRPVAWLNPMPRRRWTGTTAAGIAALPGLAMAEMNDDGLIQAIDYLRGKTGG